MGQAKERGTFEQRKAQSIERNELRLAQLRKEYAERTPAQKAKDRKGRMTAVQLMAMCGAFKTGMGE